MLDPLKAGVFAAVTMQKTSPHTIARLDIEVIAGLSRDTNSVEVLDEVLRTVTDCVCPAKSVFRGVLLASWQVHFAPIVFNELVKHLNRLGLDVYLELSGPAFLTEVECSELNLDIVSGIICRNGTILPNGDGRDYFQMAGMRRAFRAFSAQSAMSGGSVIMWETIDDNVELDHAVAKRSYIWCRFNSGLNWVGAESSLFNADIAVTRTLAGDPLGALMWLKEDEIMQAHDVWRLNGEISKEANNDDALYESLGAFVPHLAEKLALLPMNDGQRKSQTFVTTKFDWSSPAQFSTTDPFSYSARGEQYEGLGCFQLGLECNADDFEILTNAQLKLRDLSLLQRIESTDLRMIGAQLQEAYDTHGLAGVNQKASTAIRSLIQQLTASNGDDNDQIKLYVGLHSGFHNNLDHQFWGLFDFEPSSGCTSIFISGNTCDRVSTLLHTFMSSRGCSRTQCFQAEMALAKVTGSLSAKWRLPKRFVQDIEALTPTEALLFVQRLVSSNNENFSELDEFIKPCIEYQLMEVPSLKQLRALNAEAYLSGKVSVQDLVKSRLAWYDEKHCQVPDFSSAVCVFEEIETRLAEILMAGDTQLLARIGEVFRAVMVDGKIDARADFFALSVICAVRKLAFSEVYLEILDRNPLPNEHPDQAACFAEMFALGSRCDSYFDTTPDALGQILAARYKAYFKLNQPPLRDDAATELPTTYASKQTDLDPNSAPLAIPMYYSVSFLGIFALPALIDITLLTTIGRGLYLTAYMQDIEKSMATTALMVSLILCGSIGTWISSGGNYYLHSMAFPAMNMYVLTRYVAGFAVCLFGGLIAFFAIGATKGWYAGVIFFLYLVLLTTYLLTLASLAIYQVPGFMFQSGRIVIMCCIPILFISPIITLWIGHDIVVYLCVIAGFLVFLVLGLRQIMSQWATWYLKVPCVSDTEVVNWYTTQHATDAAAADLGVSTDLSATPLPRKALYADVIRERSRKPWQKRTTDEVVLRLTDGYAATMFLMDWYCKYSRTKMPYPYSPTWNLQCKAAVQTLRDTQKGLKLHNAFVHWRHASDEVWCGVLYFVIALMDKWVALLSGSNLVGLSDAGSERFRLSVGFGLAYYLIGALCLDAVAQPLWALANKAIPQPITSLAFLREAAINDARAKRHLYWKSLIKFFFVHVWGMSVTAALMWTFEASEEAVIMFLAYTVAYSGLLWYQYNRIFTGPIAFKNLLVAAICGLVVGPVLRDVYPTFAFAGVIALGVGTWTAAILSLITSRVGRPKFDDASKNVIVKDTSVFFSSGGASSDTPLSQSTLSKIYRSTIALPQEECFRLDPSSPAGNKVMEILTSPRTSYQSKPLQHAFTAAQDMLQKSRDQWKDGKIIVDLVSARQIFQNQYQLRSVSNLNDDRLHILVFVGLDYINNEWVPNIHRNYAIAAEAIIQASFEARFGVAHEHSALAELLVTETAGTAEDSLPVGVKRQLESSALECSKIIKIGDKAQLRHSLLGLDCDIQWDCLPPTIRSFLYRRCCGISGGISEEQLQWISSTFCESDLSRVEEYVSRCNLSIEIARRTATFAATQSADVAKSEPWQSESGLSADLIVGTAVQQPKMSFFSHMVFSFFSILYALRTCIKFIVISLVADPEYQRELDYVLSHTPSFVHWPITFLLDGIWIGCNTMQRIIIPLFFFHGRETISKVHTAMKGSKVVVKNRRIVIESIDGTSTCFISSDADEGFQLHQYSGVHEKQPESASQLIAINTYSKNMRLVQRNEFTKGSIVNSFEYDYQTTKSELPMEKRCVSGAKSGENVQYDERGFIFAGSAIRKGALIESTYYYRKNAKSDDELLSATYLFPTVSIKVLWAVKPRGKTDQLDEWIPHGKVLEAIFIEHKGEKAYRSVWRYDHKFHPVITTTLDGLEVATPAMIKEDSYKIFEKPSNVSFQNDDPLFGIRSVSTNVFSSLLRLNVRYSHISTSKARTFLWQSWKKGTDIDAVTARWLDESALRADKILKPYWAARDLGLLAAGEEYLNSQVDNIVTRVDLEHEISQWALIAFKISDLYSFGQGGDARINTRDQTTQLGDSDSKLHVLAMDTGTWPMESGGVSACRRDMVDNLDSIRWHVLAESANDFGVPRFQIQKNVQSLTVLPLWGLDFLTPTHGVFQSCLDSAVQQRSQDTSEMDIIKNFIPILTTLVRCSRATKLSAYHLEEAGKALIDLNNYFTESARHWSVVWNSKIVKRAWQELWLSEDVENARPLSEWLDAEKPTLQHLDNALDMWHRYLFIFSVPVPDQIPDVVQASHHFAGASYGVLCKLKRNSTLHVWDHCISWREVTVFLSSAMSFDAPFVCTSLMSLSKLACHLILHHADVVLPCADFFNPGWEVELGTIQGAIEHRNRYKRKIDPVVNGICNMERFKPIEQIKSKLPTVTMLSHVRFVKDIKVAILAADMIVNEWHFSDYRLEIWGDMEKAPAYSVECQEIIASKGLRANVALKGLGSPNKVLEDAWIFLNSSVSEGLPLAMGEAALTGVPVVCTDVGASFRVVTDPVTKKRFSAVVAPNDALSLARAQIDVLALLGEWSAYADDDLTTSERPKLPLNPTPAQARAITQRMHDKTPQRRRLGMMGRTNVLSSFSSDRYLREHEQMLWIGKHQSKSHHSRLATTRMNSDSDSFGKGSREERHWFSEEDFAQRASSKPLPTGHSSRSLAADEESGNAGGAVVDPVSRRLGTSLWKTENFSLSTD